MTNLITQTIDIQSQLQRSGTVQLNLSTILTSFAGTALILAGLLTFFYMLWGALDWILAGGEKGKIDDARKKITQGLVGLTLVASIFALFRIIQYYFGLNIVISP